MTPAQFIHHDTPTPGTHFACKDWYDFAIKYATMAEVWDACPRPDWMLWILDHLNIPAERERWLFACWCVESTPGAAPLTDPRSIEAVRVARLFAEGQATRLELSAAWSAASSAPLSAAECVAWSAAERAAKSATECVAWSAAERAWSAAKSAQADHLRTLIPNPFKETP